ncbi:SusC/RagA family TonB-linked outer membrane protein [Paraflavitalea sp. CAU 1676]|uniref:SusC/RagA family TonB-linked outer membrane protein n=1 Tax=Paraflavitalea sp. CAU 1676 TaxID=3032598 RepID=UPI0023DB00AF|nr:SusC/RagA family TonB-linked outer membrane protein [Paraflavitalea sp. CAU 1676]MDF2192405.1 SusC/RagA family TonB-linked outer membrane protein [Paraflavitalea sp. CAU 1676]
MTIILLLAGGSVATAQSIQGTVVDDKNAPIEGASAVLTPGNRGTVTNKDGKFTYSQLSPGSYSVEVSFIGFESQTKAVTVGASGVATISFSLKASETKTEAAVVVTAFGVTQQKRSLGYSLQEVKAQAITESHQPNLVNALQGKVAGVQITNSGGAPGASSIMLIRGGTSLSSNNQPLYVIDGIPMDNSTAVTQGTNLVGQSAPPSNRAIDLNPEDVQSVTVLKGPAAAALYGLRAASGAVIITTKKGAAGKSAISYSGTVSFDHVNQLPDMQSTYKQGEQGVYDPAAIGSWGPQFNSGETIYDNLGNFFKSGFTQRHDVSFSGGNDRTTFYASGSYFDQDGIVEGTDFTRKSFRVSADSRLSDKFRVGGGATYARTDRRYVLQGKGVAEASSTTTSGGGTMLGVIFWPKNDDMRNYLNPDGSQRTIVGTDNPYWGIKNNPITDDVDRFIFVGNAIYDPWKFLNITYRLGTDYYTDNFSSVRAAGTKIIGEEKGAISQSTRNSQITTSTLLVTGKHTIANDFNLSLTLGNNIEVYRSQTEYWYGRNFINPTFPSINNTNTNDRTISQSIQKRRIVGVFGDFSADWKGIVFVNVRGRNDWSSTLPVTNRSFFYPAVSTSIVVTDLLEELGTKVTGKTFSYAKIRASWARVGKDAPPHVLATTLSNVTNTFTINPRGFILNSNDYFGNPSLRPEFTNSIELGGEVRFLDNRLGFDLTYYRTLSDDQILATRTPPSSGSFLAYLNGGSIRNKGVELMVNGTAIRHTNFSWQIDLNLAKNTATVESLPGSLDRVELSDAWAAGNVAQGAAFLYGSLFGINGNVWKRDAKGQLLLANNGYPQVQSTYQNIGDRNPDWVGGITNTFTYKSLSLAFMWDVRIGGDIYNATENYLVRSGQSPKTLNRGSSMVFDGIIESTGAKNTQSVLLDQNYYQTIYPFHGYDFVEDGSWYRLRYATLTYNFPRKLLGRTPFTNAQVSVTGRNLILITDYSGVDPEVSGSGAGVGGTGSFGFDNLGIPATRGVDISLKITL